MTTAQGILDELRPLGSASYKKVLFNHGVQEPCFGVNTKVNRPSGWAASQRLVYREMCAEWLSRISLIAVSVG